MANTFIPNPDNKPFVDHINHDKSDYHISNLRWVTVAENNNNITQMRRCKYEFVDELINDAVEINNIGDWVFENYYVNGTDIVKFDGIKYRVLIKHVHNKQWKIYMTDKLGVLRAITKYRLERELAEDYEMEFDLN